jgi:hypothetical protein
MSVKFASTVYERAPEPGAGTEFSVIQFSDSDAVHTHAVPLVLTLILSLPPSTEKFLLVTGSEYVHAGCKAVNVWPAIVIVPDRCAPVLPANVQLTVPLPVPDEPDVTVIHDGALLTAVQGQTGTDVVTAIDAPVPAFTPTLSPERSRKLLQISPS